MLDSSIKYQFKDHNIFSAEAEKKIFEMYIKETSPHRKRKFRDEIIEHNIRFVAKTAFYFRKKFSRIPMRDIIGYGMLGLFTAIDRFDPGKGQKFITYCVWWVRQSIISNIQENESSVRYPSHVHQRIQNKIKFASENNEPEDDEVKIAINTMLGGVSLNDGMYPNSELSLSDVLKDNNEYANPDQIVEHELENANLNQALSKLSTEEKRIIESCYGINRIKQNMDAIGEDLNMSRESVRIKKKKSLKKLRKIPAMQTFFREYGS